MEQEDQDGNLRREDRDKRRSQIHGSWGSWRSRRTRQEKDQKSAERWVHNCNGRIAEEKGRVQ